jgi:hypothetical protein
MEDLRVIDKLWKDAVDLGKDAYAVLLERRH